MGTNYYVFDDSQFCECCGRGGIERHIGKSSAGWVFALAVCPDDGLRTFDDWREYLKRKHIEDEYGSQITYGEMLSRITNRGRDDSCWDRKPYGYDSWENFHAQNHSVRGPKGLLRSEIDGRHCVGHGEGTWDYHSRGFS